MNLLKELFSSQVRSEVFRILFTEPEVELHLREVVRRSGLALRTVQQDLTKLAQLELVVARRDGNRLQLRANAAHPLFSDLRSIVQKTSGVVPFLRSRLTQVAGNGKISCAFVFGSIAEGKEKAHSDVDLMVIGAIGLRALTQALSGAAEHLGREINPHVLKADGFKKRLLEKERFLTQVMRQPRAFVVGDEHELGKLVKERMAETS